MIELVISGVVAIRGRRVEAKSKAVFTRGDDVKIVAHEPATDMTLGGETIGPRYIAWTFVFSLRDRIELAKADWRAGRRKLPDFDHDEAIPLPA